MPSQPTIALHIDASGFSSGLRDAANTIARDFAAPAAQSAGIVSEAFGRVFSSMESAIGRAARTGEFSIRSMVDAMLRDLSRLAFDRFIEKPITNFLESALGNLLNFGGARAGGGPVSGAHAYLVGERGPELFVPAGAGRIDAGFARAAPVIHFNVTARDAESFRRSETQIAAMLARAVARGQRGM